MEMELIDFEELKRIFSHEETINAFKMMSESIYLLLCDINSFNSRVRRYENAFSTMQIAREEFARSVNDLNARFVIREGSFSLAFETLSQVHTSLPSNLYMLALFTLCCLRIVRVLDVDFIIDPFSVLEIFVYLLESVDNPVHARNFLDYFSSQTHAFFNNLGLIIHLVDNEM